MFLIDFEKGKLISDEEIKKDVASQHPYKEWNSNQIVNLKDLSASKNEEIQEDLIPKCKHLVTPLKLLNLCFYL